MSLDKAVAHGKTRRKPYFGAKALSCSCRNHGTCDWCQNDREIAKRRAAQKAQDELKHDRHELLGFEMDDPYGWGDWDDDWDPTAGWDQDGF
jgi:hypothetical protein